MNLRLTNDEKRNAKVTRRQKATEAPKRGVKLAFVYFCPRVR